MRTSLYSHLSQPVKNRDDAVDVLRGLAILGMVLVNHWPPTQDVYRSLRHADFLGWTVADTIFPLFLFLVGISIGYTNSRPKTGSRLFLYRRIIRRSAILFGLNLLLINFPYYDNLILTGTLARIAVCYLVVAALTLHTGWRTQLAITLVILTVQWSVLTLVSVPGFGPAVFSVEGNASVFIDKLVFGDAVDRLVLNGPVSQGVLPHLSSVATTIVGVLTGFWLVREGKTRKAMIAMLISGLMLFVAGWAWGKGYPVSKPLWTGSYVVLMAGLSIVLLVVVNWMSRWGRVQPLLLPLRVAGLNALFFYLLAQSMQRLLVYIRFVNEEGDRLQLRQYLFEVAFEPISGGPFGALLYALCFLFLCYVPVHILYRQRIFIRL